MEPILKIQIQTTMASMMERKRKMERIPMILIQMETGSMTEMRNKDQTDPLNPDSDGDGLDGEEIINGTNPNDLILTMTVYWMAKK